MLWAQDFRPGAPEIYAQRRQLLASCDADKPAARYFFGNPKFAVAVQDGVIGVRPGLLYSCRPEHFCRFLPVAELYQVDDILVVPAVR